ncbi:MAG: DUF2190 family protein [Methylorubrum rhodinum]|uniref:DUF2190 family protein n=1 Tax=Methylorubrum rhodinum TaxID=29428 RepID=UPI003BAF5F5D
MQNYTQRGKSLTAIAPAGGVVSGQPVAVGKLFGVAAQSAPAGASYTLELTGVFTLSKTSAQAWAQGDTLYWDAANSLVTSVNSGSLLPAGYAADVAANPSSIGSVLLARSPV